MITVFEQPVADRAFSAWMERIREEYREFPGLNLTQAQMQRLWGLEPDVCAALIESLVAAHVLRRSLTGELVVYESRDNYAAARPSR